MDTEKIIQDLNRRFAAPLPEFYCRRIIFWYDEDQEFADKLDEIELDNAKIVRLTGSNTFAVKKLLSFEDEDSNYLVYAPFAYPDQEENWLLDIELYSEQFHADLVSIWMDELGLPMSPAIRDTVKRYRKFFNSKERRQKLSAQNRTASNPNQLATAIIAALCGLKDPRPHTILRTMLAEGVEQGSNPFYQNLVSYGAENDFWAMVARGCGYLEPAPDLGELATHLILTAATKTIRYDLLAELEHYLATPYQAYCYDFVHEWLSGPDSADYRRIARFAEEKTRLCKRLEKLQIEDLVSTESLPCVHEIILHRLMTDISHDIIDPEVITSVVEKRKSCVWYGDYADFYEGVLQIANMQRFFRDHAGGFHTADPVRLWQEYTSDYYRMDTYYRLFQRAFQRSLEQSNPLLDDLFKKVVEKGEGLYRYWYLGALATNWTNACTEDMAVHGKVLDIPQQTDFYRYRVKNAGNRVYVIISDALRYEVGASLAEQLRLDGHGKVSLSAMQSIFPSYTKYGMAALLPHQKLSVAEQGGSLAVFADGMSTASGSRERVLKAANPLSVALQYKDIVAMKRAERTALVRGMEVVYIYHDLIDETGHDNETDVFAACERTISNLVNLVKIIVNDFGGTNILITADHGFLYTYSPLVENDKVSKASLKGREVDLSRRYVVASKGATPDHLMPVQFMDDGYDAYAPRDNIRIKMSGSGLNFVHGGISLQEMVVPVVEYRHLRNDYAEYQRNKDRYDTKPVSVQLLSATRRICNMVFSLNFYQKEAVGGNLSAASYQVYLTDAYGKQVSDIQRIIADKTAENATDRTYRCSFSLKPLRYSNTAQYYLVIANEQEQTPTIREEFQIDIAFDGEDFDY